MQRITAIPTSNILHVITSSGKGHVEELSRVKDLLYFLFLVNFILK